MNDLEDVLQHHLHAAAEQAVPIPDVDAVMRGDAILRPRVVGGERRRWGAAAAAAVVIGMGGVGLMALRTDRDPATSEQPGSTIDTEVASTFDLNGGQIPVPGMTEIANSASTPESDTFASYVFSTLLTVAPSLELRESEIRTTDDGDQVMWVYFLDGDRRLFIAQGQPDLLIDSVLLAGPDGYEWPAVAGVGTIAVSDAASTVIVRSESVEPGGATRSPDDLRLIAQLVKNGAPEIGSGSIGPPIAVPQAWPVGTIYSDLEPQTLVVDFVPPNEQCIVAQANATIGRGGAVLVSLFVDAERLDGECPDGADSNRIRVPLSEPLEDRRIYTRTEADTGGASQGAEEVADAIIGVEVLEAQDAIRTAGYEVRDITGLDAVEEDFNTGRINIITGNGIVEFAYVS